MVRQTSIKGWELGDRSLVEPYLAEDLIDTSSGKRYNRDDVLGYLQPRPEGVVVNIVEKDVEYRIRNNTAVVSYVGEYTRTREGEQELFRRYWATTTFYRHYGRWQIIAHQMTPEE